MELNAETKVHKLCEELKIPTPVEFLTHAMSGCDPRRVSLVYQRVIALEEEYGAEPPDEWDWQDLVELIKTEYRGSIVGMAQSQSAASQLMEYMYPKRKSVDKTVTNVVHNDTPLSKVEIKQLRKEFDLDY